MRAFGADQSVAVNDTHNGGDGHALPAANGPFRTFVFSGELSYPVTSHTRTSSVRLYDNGAFVLSYFCDPGGYRGAYTESGGAVAFEWEGWSAAGPWGARGTLSGGTLTIEFNSVMPHSTR